jgi:hypothetical protein
LKIRKLIKAIFFVSALINLSPSSKATQFFAIDSKNFSQSKSVNWVNNVFPKNIDVSSKTPFPRSEYNYKSNSKNEILHTYKDRSPTLLANSFDNKNELEIQSEIQSEENNILKAKGNVLVLYRGNILKADSLIYDKTQKTVSAKGNISLSIGEQLFKMNRFQYDFNSKKGYLFDVKGLIKTDNLIDDLFSNVETSDIKNIEISKEIFKEKVLNTPGALKNWIFITDKIEIDGEKWKSEKAIFTNDLIELKQVKIEINSLEAISRKDQLRFKSSLNYLILDEKISVPFWFGERTLTKSGESFSFENRWNIGYDNVDKDGYFIGRKLNSINLFDDFVLDLEPQFLIQRSLQGHTKSFVSKGDSITADKVKRDAYWEDYFGLNSQIKGKISNWNLEIDKQINSFDPDESSNSLRVKSNLSKEISFLNSKWDKSFFGVFRDRVWNGSLGESEVYTGYGSKLEKQNTWEVNGITKSETLSLGLGNFKGENLNSKNLVTSIKGSLFYSSDQKIPLNGNKASNKFIDSSFKYISEPIKKGLSLNTSLELFYAFYKNGNNQQYLGFGAGPEFILGDLQKKYFDYTRISLLPFYKIKSGDSLFKFDQIADKFTLDIAFDQQLFGPLILKSNASLNLDSDSKDYGDFINSKISLNWKKRSYEFGIFYQPHNEAGGISFTLFGFE